MYYKLISFKCYEFFIYFKESTQRKRNWYKFFDFKNNECAILNRTVLKCEDNKSAGKTEVNPFSFPTTLCHFWYCLLWIVNLFRTSKKWTSLRIFLSSALVSSSWSIFRLKCKDLNSFRESNKEHEWVLFEYASDISANQQNISMKKTFVHLLYCSLGSIFWFMKN